MKHIFRCTKSYFRAWAVLILCLCYGCASTASDLSPQAAFTQAAQTAFPQQTAFAATQQYYASIVTVTDVPPDPDQPIIPLNTPTVGIPLPSATPVPALTAAPTPTLQNTPSAPGSEAACIPANPPQTGKVLDILDGDTIKVMIDGKTFTVRYIGIDAPETLKTKDYYGAQARLKNSDLVYAKDVTLYRDSSETDSAGRLLRYVKVGDTFVNWALVAQGFAKALPTAPDVACDAVFQGAQEQASAAKTGMWGKP